VSKSKFFLAMKNIHIVVSSPALRILVWAMFFWLLDEYLLGWPQVHLLLFSRFFHPVLQAILYTTTILSFGLLVAFLYMLRLATAWGKAVVLVFLGAAILVQYSFQTLLGRFIVPGDVIMGLNSGIDVWFDAGTLYFQPKSLIPMAAIGLFLLLNRAPSRPKESGLIFTLILVSLVLMGAIPVEQITTAQADKAINYGWSSLQFAATVVQAAKQKVIKPERQELDLSLYSLAHAAKKNIVLIIDESVRADHLGVNGYARQTTPHLSSLSTERALFHNWGIAVAGATCSELSNGLILTGLPIEPDSPSKIRKAPTLFQYAKAVGYETYYLDAQTTVFWNGLSENDIVYIDHLYRANQFGDNPMVYDFVAAKMIREMVISGSGKLT